MPANLTCPDEDELIAMAFGKEPAEDVRQHLAACPGCRERLEKKGSELAELRAAAAAASSLPSTVNYRKVDPPSTNGHAELS
jgi:hypothetical protein